MILSIIVYPLDLSSLREVNFPTNVFVSISSCIFYNLWYVMVVILLGV